MAGVPVAVEWKAWASLFVRGEVVGQDEVMYYQKASLVHSP